MPVTRHVIILTNAKLDSRSMYASTGCNVFVDDNDNKCMYILTAKNTDMREMQWYKTSGHYKVYV